MADPKHTIPAILIGTGEFSFCETSGALSTTLLGGWLDFGNIVAFTPQPEVTSEEHYGSYRGTRRRDKTIATQTKLTYELKCDEWNYELLKVLFGATATTGHTQSVQSAVSGDAWVFAGGTPSGTTKWYDVKVGGNRIRRLTALTIATLVEGTDFEVDFYLGRVRFLTTQTTSRTPTVTAPAITSSDNDYFNGLTPFGDVVKQGYGRIIVYDQDDNNKVAFEHLDFSCEVMASSAGEINGTGVSELTLVVTVTSEVGKVLVRKANLV